MEVTTGLQSNCSDLVSHLGMQTSEELRIALKKIVKELKLQVNLEINLSGRNKFTETQTIAIPEHFIEQLSISMLDSEDLRPLHKFIFLYPLLRSKGIKTGRRRVWYYGFSITKRMKDKIRESFGYPKVNLRFGDGYDTDTEVVISTMQHCTVSDFPLFTSIRKLFKKDYHAHDGGSVTDYEEWLEKNKIRD
jgi:hypothetical protein